MTTTPLRPNRLMSRLPLHYSWVVLLAGAIGMIMSSPGQTFAVSIFIEHFIRELGLSRSLVSSLYTAGTLVASLGLPVSGRLIDRYGTAPVAAVAAALLGLACIAMGWVNGAVTLGLGFFALRMLGQGSMELVSATAINHWWVRRRGMALGIAGLLVSVLGTGSFPSLINGLIERFGWRPSYRLLGLAVIAVMVPVALLLFRRPPEDYGLLPDGGLVKEAPSSEGATPSPTSPAGRVEENWTVKEATKTAAFWIAGIALGSMSMLTTGLHFHMISIAQDAGLDAATAATIYIPLALTASLISLGGGILVDRLQVRLLLAAALVLQSASLVMAPYLSGVTMAFGYGIVLGMTMGLASTVRGVIWADYFGRRHLGSITGTVGVFMVAGSALGPMPFGIARDLLGNYQVVLLISAALPLILALLVLSIRRPTRAEREAS